MLMMLLLRVLVVVINGIDVLMLILMLNLKSVVYSFVASCFLTVVCL